MTGNRTPIGFRKIAKYPGNRLPLGVFEPYTTGELLQYPDVWEPVYDHPVNKTADQISEAFRHAGRSHPGSTRNGASEILGGPLDGGLRDAPAGIRGDRWNKGKLRWSLMDLDALAPMIRVLEFGSKKYSDHNWKKGLLITELLESTIRHIQDLQRGEDNDPESNLPHTGHILCNAMFLSYMMIYRPEMDNRFMDPAKTKIILDQGTKQPGEEVQ